MRILTAAFALCLAATGFQVQAANCDAEIEALEDALDDADFWCDTSRPDNGQNAVCEFKTEVIIPHLNARVLDCFRREDSTPVG